MVVVFDARRVLEPGGLDVSQLSFTRQEAQDSPEYNGMKRVLYVLKSPNRNIGPQLYQVIPFLPVNKQCGL